MGFFNGIISSQHHQHKEREINYVTFYFKHWRLTKWFKIVGKNLQVLKEFIYINKLHVPSIIKHT